MTVKPVKVLSSGTTRSQGVIEAEKEFVAEMVDSYGGRRRAQRRYGIGGRIRGVVVGSGRMMVAWRCEGNGYGGVDSAMEKGGFGQADHTREVEEAGWYSMMGVGSCVASGEKGQGGSSRWVE